jgi:predicted RNA binding protein YcfA (HicA-like mRNA interferase family)
MKLPRDLSGEELAVLLCKHWCYARIHQVGSHIILQTEVPVHHRISVPAHQQLRIGTLNSILRSVANSKGVPRDAILKSASA